MESTESNSLVPASNEIWYTNGSTTEATIPCTNEGFGAEIISNSYDTEKGCWILSFDREITAIGSGAFARDKSLISIQIPNSVTTIEDHAFRSCTNLETITIPYGVTSIGERAFIWCTKLKNINIPESVTFIGDFAFKNCESLISINIPNGVVAIGERTFYECRNLISVTFPETLLSIGTEAFEGCSNLANIYCKAKLPPFGDYWFSAPYTNIDCKIYVYEDVVNLYKSNADWGKFAKYIIGYDFTNKRECNFDRNQQALPANDEIWYTNGSTTEATTPKSEIGFGASIISNTYDASHNCWVIKFNAEISSIGESAFANCRDLITITLPGSITSIADKAFNYCTALMSVIIPSRVTTIGYGAFAECKALKSVYCKATIPPIFAGDFVFDYFTHTKIAGGGLMHTPYPIGCNIYVPFNALDAYKSQRNWAKYNDHISAYDYENNSLDLHTQSAISI